MKLLFSTGLICLLLTISTLGQKGEVSVEFSEPPLNQKLPIPEYPKAARKIELKGSVAVTVTIDGQGNVTKAEASRFHPACPSITTPEILEVLKVSIESAKKAKFKESDYYSSRTRVVRYTFALPEKEEPEGKTQSFRVVNDQSNVNADKAKDGKDDPLPNAGKGGVLNGKAISLPKPSYPAAARLVKATGAVSVQILISEDGTIYSAEAISGDPLLRSSAEIAACNATFTPTLLSGKPVKVFGTITYNYVP